MFSGCVRPQLLEVVDVTLHSLKGGHEYTLQAHVVAGWVVLNLVQERLKVGFS